MNEKASLAVFQEKEIRRTWHQQEWWFSVYDVVAVLSESARPADYVKKMRLRDKELAQGGGQIVTPLGQGGRTTLPVSTARCAKGGGNLPPPFAGPKTSDEVQRLGCGARP